MNERRSRTLEGSRPKAEYVRHFEARSPRALGGQYVLSVISLQIGDILLSGGAAEQRDTDKHTSVHYGNTEEAGTRPVTGRSPDPHDTEDRSI